MTHWAAPGLLLLCVGCARAGASQGSAPEDPTAEHARLPPLPQGAVLLHDSFGGEHTVQVEVANDEPSRSRGLMWRTALPEGTGMIFVFPKEAPQSFWMRNTLIPLDLLFIDARLRVVGIVAQAEPQTLSPRAVARPAGYVLEVPGGWAERAGIRAGSRVELRGALLLQMAKP